MPDIDKLLNNGALVVMAGAFIWLVRYVVTSLQAEIKLIKEALLLAQQAQETEVATLGRLETLLQTIARHTEPHV